MTTEEFASTRFGKGDKVKLAGDGTEYLIYEVDFEYGLISIYDELAPEGTYLTNYHCSDCELIPYSA